jgi:hypothetical protein
MAFYIICFPASLLRHYPAFEVSLPRRTPPIAPDLIQLVQRRSTGTLSQRACFKAREELELTHQNGATSKGSMTIPWGFGTTDDYIFVRNFAARNCTQR